MKHYSISETASISTVIDLSTLVKLFVMQTELKMPMITTNPKLKLSSGLGGQRVPNCKLFHLKVIFLKHCFVS